jgi:pyruvate-formate lyase-activating enzyme
MEKRAESAGDGYGFRGRLKAGFPSQVIADITEVCNLACIHCPHSEFQRSRHYGARYLDPDLNAKLVDEVCQHGQGVTEYIRYASNGEPLIHPKSLEMIEYAARHSGVYVTLTTNGTLLDRQRTQRLLGSGLHMIDISIDAFSAKTYGEIRVRGDFKVTRANVLNLIEEIRRSKASTKVVVSFVEQPQNKHETSDFERFWKEHGADSVVIRRLHSCSGAKIELASERRTAISGQERRPCLYPWERIVLSANGELSFCPASWTQDACISDYRRSTIREVWQGEFYRGLRQAHLSSRFEGFGFCGQCPDWEATRWPEEGRSYADMIRDFKEKG